MYMMQGDLRNESINKDLTLEENSVFFLTILNHGNNEIMERKQGKLKYTCLLGYLHVQKYADFKFSTLIE